jgi:uncharacterized lipoprotein YmbA
MRPVIAGVALLVAAGCFTRSAGGSRFFRPSSALLHETADPPVERAADGAPAIRLRGVDADSFRRERIVWRMSDVEYGVYEQRRWVDVPSAYVDRALHEALRRRTDVRLSDDLRVPSLHVYVTAFDEAFAPTHAAIVAATATLRDASGRMLLDRRFSAESPIGGDDPALMARAMGAALDEVASGIADAVAGAAVAVAPAPAATKPAHRNRR